MTAATQEIHVRDQRKPRHYWCDNEIITVYGKKIGAYGVAVYNVLAKFADNNTGECRTTARQIGDLIDLSPPSVSRALKALEREKLIQVTFRSQSPQQGPSIYTVLEVEKVISKAKDSTVSRL